MATLSCQALKFVIEQSFQGKNCLCNEVIFSETAHLHQINGPDDISEERKQSDFEIAVLLYWTFKASALYPLKQRLLLLHKH